MNTTKEVCGDVCTIHHKNGSVCLKTKENCVCIAEKDISLLRRGIPRPLRDQAGKPLGRDHYAYTYKRVVYVKSAGVTLAEIPVRLLNDEHPRTIIQAVPV